MTYLDLSHPLTQNIPVYPGDPVPQIVQNNSITKDGFTSHTITVGTHVGTHMDAPAHMIENGKNISEFPTSKFFGRGVLIDARNQSVIDAPLLASVNLQPDDSVLIYTGRSHIFNKAEYFTRYPPITIECAQALVDAKVKMVGMDQASPDYSPFETHKLLLQNDILIIENLTNLSQLLGKQFTITALPLNVECDAAPVRVIAYF
jgi:kynurenine formamidase